MSAKEGELVLKPALPNRLGLDDLFAGVTAGNLHSSVDAGEAVGLEIFSSPLCLCLVAVIWCGWSSPHRLEVSKLGDDRPWWSRQTPRTARLVWFCSAQFPQW